MKNSVENTSTIIMGNDGTGKTHGILVPEILRGNSNYAINDPCGELYLACGKDLAQQGYRILRFSTEDISSVVFNPIETLYGMEPDKSLDDFDRSFWYGEWTDLKKRCIKIIAREYDPDIPGDPFMEKSEAALLEACMEYLNLSDGDFSFAGIYALLQEAASGEEGLAYLGEKFKIFADENASEDDLTPYNIANNYDYFRLSPAKTALFIAGDLLSKIEPLVQRPYGSILQCDKQSDSCILNFADLLGSEKTALFIQIPSVSESASIVISLLFEELLFLLGDKKERRHLCFVLDNFHMMPSVQSFPAELVRLKKENASAIVCIYSMAEVIDKYGPYSGGDFLSSFENMIYTGSDFYSVYKELQEFIGEDRISIDEIAALPRENCIVAERGEEPCIREIAEFSKKNIAYSVCMDRGRHSSRVSGA